ncbi:uncharacterized protein LOC124273096 [Haliotis rubra]|uniref:uncharacterized protein LOC124273096 n=1 Tax=Haliotis rubra TaxID=36100 RepID=UPI001EE5BED0|nr:uncharacterized protein LOC124273096 [Haliotis rubra]
MDRPQRQTIKQSCRNLKSIDNDEFRRDLVNSDLLQDPPNDVNQLAELYSSTLSSLLDKHAPSALKEIIVRSGTPWYNEQVLLAKRKRRAAERKWRKSRLEIHRQLYKSERNSCARALRGAKSSYCTKKLSDNVKNPSFYHKFMGSLLGKKNDTPLPSSTNDKDLADNFSANFSTAFDTVNHQKLLSRLQDDYNIQGDALAWFHSYLSTRSQSVLVSESMSESTILECGVPQGSVLGSLLFVLYTNPLEKVIDNFDVNHHAFADDLQFDGFLQTRGCTNSQIKGEAVHEGN